MKWFEKDIKIGHFYYLIIIAAIIVIFVVGMNHWGVDEAGIILNNIATTTSIILAVLAIVITLVDVAGQKKSVEDIRNHAEKIEEVMKKSEDLLTKTEKQYAKFSSLHSNLIEKSEETNETYESLRDMISIIQNEKVDKEKINDTLEKIMKDFKENNRRESRLVDTSRIKPVDSYMNEFIEEFVIKTKVSGEDFTKWDIQIELEHETGNRITLDLTEKTLDQMVEKGLLHVAAVTTDRIKVYKVI